MKIWLAKMKTKCGLGGLKRPWVIPLYIAICVLIPMRQVGHFIEDHIFVILAVGFVVTTIGSMIIRKKCDWAAFIHGIGFPVWIAGCCFFLMGWALEDSSQPHS